MRIGYFPLLLIALASFAAEQNPLDRAGNPDLQLRDSCQHVCVEARTAGEVSRCVATRESLQGSRSFKKAHPQCYKAREEYQAFLNREDMRNEPERYG